MKDFALNGALLGLFVGGKFISCAVISCIMVTGKPYWFNEE